MTNTVLIKQLLKRLKKYSWIIILIALVIGAVFFIVAKKDVLKYVSKTTAFPLNGSGDNVSPLGGALGLSSSNAGFGSDAAVNIIELATSRNTNRVLAGMKIKEFSNKTIAQLLIEENNLHSGFLKNQFIVIPKDSQGLINIGAALLRGGLDVKIGKTGVLELIFKNSNQNLVRVISYAYIDKISAYYINLKKEKAEADYEFAVQKVDSLSKVIKQVDNLLVKQEESTFFTNNNLKRYSLPKINLSAEKELLQKQYFSAVNNRENAAYTLQKETPIVKILDSPEPPYGAEKKSSTTYTALGLFIGMILGTILVSFKFIIIFLKQELQ